MAFGRPPEFFVIAMSQSPGLPGTLATAYNPGMCLLALPVITTVTSQNPGLYKTLMTAYYPGMCLLALPVIVFAAVAFVLLICYDKGDTRDY